MYKETLDESYLKCIQISVWKGARALLYTTGIALVKRIRRLAWENVSQSWTQF